MPYYLMWPNDDDLIDSGFGAATEIPYIMTGDWSYHRTGSRYLRERAQRTFIPSFGKPSGGDMTRKSMETFGESLCNFLEWCEYKGFDWTKLLYKEHLLDGYQKEMRNGTFAHNQRMLSASTVNLRIGEACNFLEWGFKRGLRSEFVVPMEIRKAKDENPRNSHGHKKKDIPVRSGAVRPPPISLRMPKKEEVAAWLEAVRIQRGYVKYLMCKLVIMTAIRREEAVQWRTDTLPLNKQDWNVTGHYVTVKLTYGTKGSKTKNEHGERVGPPRYIQLPLKFANELHKYNEIDRARVVAKFIREARQKPRNKIKNNIPKQLFLSENNGDYIKAQTLYDAWTEVEPQPYKGWSPHIGRHYWCCKMLIAHVESHLELLKIEKDSPIRNQIAGAFIDASAENFIQLIITPQLGHLDKKTTTAYLTWIQRQYLAIDMDEKWESHLES